MAYDIPKGGSSLPILIGPVILSSDHISGATGITLTVTISKAGGAFGSPSGAVTEIANGWYKIAGNATDSNTAGPIAVHATGTGCDAFDAVVCQVIDSTVATYGTNMVQVNGQTATAAAGVTFPSSIASPTNITAGTITTATNLTNLPSIPNNWLTAAGIAASALNGKGDWLAASSYTTPPAVAAIATAVWQDGTAGDFTTAGSIGKSLFTSGNAPGAASGLALVGSNMGAVTSVSGAVGSVTGNVGGNVVGSVASVAGNVGGSVASVTAAVTVGTNNDKTGYTLTAGEKTTVAGAVWDVTLSGHVTTGSTGAALNAAGSAGDPWATALPGAYGAGTAGYLIGHNIDAAITSRLASSAMTFSVPGYADVNIRYVNSVAVNGAGTGASPWGP